MATPSDPVSVILTYGVLGVVLVLILFRRLAPGWSLDDATKRAEKAETQRDALIEDFRPVLVVLNKVNDEVLPALISAQSDLKGAGKELERLADEIRRLVDKGSP